MLNVSLHIDPRLTDDARLRMSPLTDPRFFSVRHAAVFILKSIDERWRVLSGVTLRSRPKVVESRRE